MPQDICPSKKSAMLRETLILTWGTPHEHGYQPMLSVYVPYGSKPELALSCLVTLYRTKVENHWLNPINEIPTVAEEEARWVLGDLPRAITLVTWASIPTHLSPASFLGRTETWGWLDPGLLLLNSHFLNGCEVKFLWDPRCHYILWQPPWIYQNVDLFFPASPLLRLWKHIADIAEIMSTHSHHVWQTGR